MRIDYVESLQIACSLEQLEGMCRHSDRDRQQRLRLDDGRGLKRRREIINVDVTELASGIERFHSATLGAVVTE